MVNENSNRKRWSSLQNHVTSNVIAYTFVKQPQEANWAFCELAGLAILLPVHCLSGLDLRNYVQYMSSVRRTIFDYNTTGICLEN